jgi:hypothetical protein
VAIGLLRFCIRRIEGRGGRFVENGFSCNLHPIGTYDGIRRLAMMYSLLLTNQRHDIISFEWLKNDFEKIQDYPITTLADFFSGDIRS